MSSSGRLRVVCVLKKTRSIDLERFLKKNRCDIFSGMHLLGGVKKVVSNGEGESISLLLQGRGF